MTGVAAAERVARAALTFVAEPGDEVMGALLRACSPVEIVAARVATARERTAARLKDTPWRLNAEVPGSEIRRAFAPSPEALAPLERAMDLGHISARGVDRALRVAWTLADLAGVSMPTAAETSYALGLWLGVGL